MSEITIDFHGLCTHLVNKSPHSPVKDIGLKPIHSRDPHPIDHRVLIPWSKDLPDNLKKIPEHFPRFQFHKSALTPPRNWVLSELKDGWWEVDMTRVAIWFAGVDEGRKNLPPAAQALKDLPSIVDRTFPRPDPGPDPDALNRFSRTKVAAYVDFFGDQKLVRHETCPVMNEVSAFLEVKGTPQLKWMPFGGDTVTVDLSPGAELHICNRPQKAAPCNAIDYLLHYRATKLDLSMEPLPDWKPKCDAAGLPGPDGAFCGSSTYP